MESKQKNKGKGKSNEAQPPKEDKKKEDVNKKEKETQPQTSGNKAASSPSQAQSNQSNANNNAAQKKKDSKPSFQREEGRGVVKQVLSGDTIVIINLEKRPPTGTSLHSVLHPYSFVSKQGSVFATCF